MWIRLDVRIMSRGSEAAGQSGMKRKGGEGGESVAKTLLFLLLEKAIVYHHVNLFAYVDHERHASRCGSCERGTA